MNIAPENILLLDDGIENIKGAQKMGLETIQVTSQKQMLFELNKKGITL